VNRREILRQVQANREEGPLGRFYISSHLLWFVCCHHRKHPLHISPTPNKSKSQNYPQPTMDVGVADDHSPEATISRWKFAMSRQYQHMLDKTTPHVLRRWIGCLVVAAVYVLRVYLVQGFYIVSYALGIYILNLLIGFLSPQVDPEIHDGPTLPTRGSDEFRPFVRPLPEFKFWYYSLPLFPLPPRVSYSTTYFCCNIILLASSLLTPRFDFELSFQNS